MTTIQDKDPCRGRVCASPCSRRPPAFLPPRRRPRTRHEVKIDNFAFTPQRVTVKAGTTVTWINDDDIPHTVASSTKLFKSKALDTDDKFSFTFTTPGAYEYFCSVHPYMTGTIVVEAPPEAARRNDALSAAATRPEAPWKPERDIMTGDGERR